MALIRTAIYMRVSTDRQAQEGDSVPAQREALRKYIDDHQHLTFAGEYLDDGISGTKADRSELSRLLDDVRAGRIDMLIFTKLDRWFRSVRHYTATQEILDKHGVGWLAIWEPIYDTTTPAGRLIVNQMMSIAQFEAENTGQRIRQVFAYKAAQGEVLSGRAPAGYRIEGKRLVPDELLAPVIRSIFEEYAMTGNLHHVIQYAAGYGLVKDRRNWRTLLQNRKYIGEFRGNTSYCEPIINRDLFEDVQRKLSINIKASQKYDYIFSGLLVCAECGTRMTSGQTPGKNGRIRRCYRCRKNKAAVKTCGNGGTIFENVLEDYMVANIKADVQQYLYRYEAQRTVQQDRSRQIAAANRKLSRLKDLYLNDLIGLDEYKRDHAAISQDLERLQAEDVQAAPDLSHLREVLQMDLETVYADLTNEERRHFWRTFISEIRFDSSRNFFFSYIGGLS